MIALLRRATGRMADWIWPRTCAVAACGRPSDRPNRHICSSCFAALPFLEAGGECARCGRPVPAPTQHDFVCEACQTEPPAFERFSFLLSPSADLLRTGFPMAGTGHFSGSGGSISIPLRRLFAKVEVTIDKKGLTGGTTPVLLSEHLYLRQASRRLRPFASSMALRINCPA